jgi:hypothetical protein
MKFIQEMTGSNKPYLNLFLINSEAEKKRWLTQALLRYDLGFLETGLQPSRQRPLRRNRLSLTPMRYCDKHPYLGLQPYFKVS